MKRALVAAALVLIGTAGVASAKVGFVDLSKALELTTQGKAIESKLQARKNEVELNLKQREVELLKLKDEIEKGKDALSPQVLDEKKRKFNRLRRGYERMVQEESFKFEQYKFELLQGFIKELESAAQQVAKARGLTMVLLKVEDVLTQASFVLYGDPSVDLTDDVIKLLNQRAQKQ